MTADKPYSSISRAKKREKLMDLIERIKNKEQSPVKNRDNTNSKNRAKHSTKQKKFNSIFYQKLFRGRKMKVLNDINGKTAKRSCSGPRRKKRRLCSKNRSSEIFRQSSTENKIESGGGELADFQFETPTKIHDHVLPYVNKLRDYWNRGQNTVFFDGQDRLVKAVVFVSSLLDNLKNPILIVACSSVLSLWEVEFTKCSKSVNVVTYKGNNGTRAAIRDAEFYSEKGCIKFQVLLSSLDAIVEDMEKFDHIKWELLVIDECQRPVFLPHFKKLKMLMADMKLLTVSGEFVDICQSHGNILSLLDSKFELNDNINTLKERLSPFIAFECKFNTLDFEEYWVPVHLSSMQMEQYCSILASILEAISSSSKNSSLNDILTKIQKCCDHPYLVDPILRDSSRKASSIDPLDAEINVSGKMQLLDKLLLEVKRRGLRALVLFQSAVNPEKISTGHFLDDLVHQRFGENSYVHIPVVKVLSNSECAKRKELLKLFNNVENDRFICLFDYQACHSSIKLSHVNVVILFNSVGNPLNDIKHLRKIIIDSPCERLHVFRLYSTFTIEEKVLILAKQGITVNYTPSSVCHQLLAWGAPYLFQKVQNFESICSIDDLVHELSTLLTDTSDKTGPTKCSMISKAHMQNGAYADGILLFGETETHTKESCSIDEHLANNTPSVFWSNLVKQSQHRPENSSSALTRRVRKLPRVLFEDGYLNDATTSSFVRVKPRSKRKVNEKAKRKQAGTSKLNNVTEECTQKDSLPLNLTDAQLPLLPSTSISESTPLNTRTNGGQQSQNDQPQHTSSSTPLETEIERIQNEREQIIKSHQEKKSMLLSECEKEISEVKKKYDMLIHDSETSLTKEKKILEDYQKLVDSNKLLAEILAQNWHENLNLNRSELISKRTHKDSSPLNIPNIPASALIRTNSALLTSGPTTYLSGHGLDGSRLRAPPPHLRANQPLFASFHKQPATGEPFLESLATMSTTQTLPWTQTESNCLSMAFNQIYDDVGLTLPFLG
ncbi:hypothetical protein R6Q57_010534 [Mikania cordata]